MRGNEHYQGDLTEGDAMFPIPMRGNELIAIALLVLAMRAFPIPMRGNETAEPALKRVNAQVSDPHEG